MLAKFVVVVAALLAADLAYADEWLHVYNQGESDCQLWIGATNGQDRDGYKLKPGDDVRIPLKEVDRYNFSCQWLAKVGPAVEYTVVDVDLKALAQREGFPDVANLPVEINRQYNRRRRTWEPVTGEDRFTCQWAMVVDKGTLSLRVPQNCDEASVQIIFDPNQPIIRP